MSENVLIAGVGGFLGRELLDAYLKRGAKVYGLALKDSEYKGIDSKVAAQHIANVTVPETLKGVCDGISMVVSVIGITRIQGKLTHMDVDYQGNMNLLAEAKRAGVRKFVFISPAGTDMGAHQGVPLMQAKFKFEEELKKSGLDWIIVRAGGFLRDFASMAKMAQTGPMYVIGRGDVISTPVDVHELAELMADDSLKLANTYDSIGGPKDMSWNEICTTCFDVYGKKPKITTIPVWTCQLTLFILRFFSPSYYATGKLLLFFSLNNVPTQKRGQVDLKSYLLKSRQN